MAYIVNDKVYTDQPMMDEIVYHCKIIFSEIVIKNDVLAANLEYDNSLSLSEAYIYGEENNHRIPFALFPYNKKMLIIFNTEILDPLGIGQADGSLDNWVNDKKSVPYVVTSGGQEYQVRQMLEDFCNDWFYGRLEEQGLIDFASYRFDPKFEEKNDYYRTLMGLPPYEDPALPDLPILTHQYWIYLTDSSKGTSYTDFFPSEYIVQTPDPDNTPLHEFVQKDITVLQIEGSIARIRELYPGSKYAYADHLGEKSLDLAAMRQAGKWDILYFPPIEPLVETRFLDLYESNKEIYISRFYEVAQATHSFYYDQNMIVKLLAKVFADMIVEVPEWYIRRDVLDLRSVEYFLESYGVKFFKKIPLRYQKRIVRNLNKLIKFKSSTRNFEDILDIFELPETLIYKYFLFKKRNKDGDGSYSYSAEADDGTLNFGNIDFGGGTARGDWDFGSLDNYPEMNFDTVCIDDAYYDLGDEDKDPKVDPNIDNQLIVWDKRHPIEVVVPIEAYDLEFIASEVHDSYDEYMRDSIYRTPYDDITYQDKYWDGDQDHESIRNRIKEQKFTIQGTKYMSIEYQIPANEYFFQIEYVLNLLLSSNLDTDDIRIPVPCIAAAEEFKISDLFVFLSILTDLYYRMDSHDDSTVIKRPDEITPEDFVARFDISDVLTDGNYNWKKYKLPEIYTDKKGRIFAFNPNLDKDALIEFLARRHSSHVFGRNDESTSYTTEEYVDLYLQDDLDRLGITDFIVPNGTCTTVEELIDLYHHDRECYEKFKNEVKNDLNNADDLKTMEYVYQQMYTAQFDSNFYKLSDGSDAIDMVDILRDRNYILYNKYRSIALETNRESRQDIIRQIMNDIIETLQYYLTDEGLEYIFAFTATESFNSRIEYIYLMITFFKSYKVHFIDPYVTYKINDRMLNGDINGEAAALDAITMLRLDAIKRDKVMIQEFVHKNISYVLTDTTYLEESHAEIVDIYKSFSPDPTDDYDYDGMHPRDISPNYKDANGGTSNRSKAIPYVMLNAGLTRNRVYQMWNMNGSTPAIMEDRNYSDIDGGGPLEFDFHLISPDWFGKEGFNYIVDGGSPSPYVFISNSMKMTLKHTGELGAEVRLSQKTGNVIESDPTGIRIVPKWADRGDFELFTRDYEAYYARVGAELDEAWEYIQDATDMNRLDARIRRDAEEKLYPILTVMNLVNNRGEPLIAEANEFTDQRAQELYDYFVENGSIFDWINVLSPTT